MARKPKNQRRKAKAPRHTGIPRPIRVAGPEARLRSLFKLVDDVTHAADDAGAQTIDTGEPLLMFDISIFTRGINALKSIRLLTAEAHWENAAGVVRQLFELVVNMEYLAKQPDREAATLSFAKYGLLQIARLEVHQADYDRKTDRPVDEERVKALQTFLSTQFPEFRAKDKADGTINFVSSWNRKNTRELAEASPNRLRVDQYELLFSPWSEQTHAAPAALLDGIFARASESWVEEKVAEDDRKVAEVITMGSSLFLELWQLLPRAPVIAAEKIVAWRGKLVDEGRRFAEATAPICRKG